VLDEAARIARGTILPLSELQAEDFDALVIPGGFGVAKNLSSLAFKGADAQVLPEFAAAVKAFYAAKKPIGAICIAPAVLSLILRDQGIELTIGEDEGTAGVIEATGNTHVVAQSWQAVVDKEHKIATASAYMREDRLAPIGLGIEKVIQAVLFLI
jgi:enhancing lycopene biosynthesis protein 2